MNRVLTMRDVSRLSGMSKWRVYRHLRRLNEQVQGMLLVNTGTSKKPCWTISLDALKRAAPGWFGNLEEFATRLSSLEERVEDLQVTVEVHGRALAVAGAARRGRPERAA
jgi:hypothetical protein